MATSSNASPSAKPHRRKGGIGRRPAAFLLIALLLLAGAVVIHQWDDVFQQWLQPYRTYRVRGTWSGDLMRVIRPFGKGKVIIVLALFIGACGLKRRAIEILTAFAIVGIMVFPAKKLVGRTRPSGENNASFPSGDTGGIAATAVPMMAQCARFIPVAGVLVPAVAALRVLDNNHYLSDVFTGMALGLIAGVIAMALRLDQRWLFPQIKYRHLALLSVALSMVWYAPALIRGKGTFFDFAMLFGPMLLYRQCLVYLPFRFQWPQGHTPEPWRRLKWSRNFIASAAQKLLQAGFSSPAIRHPAVAVGLPAVLTALAIYVWSHDMRNLKLALTGIILFLAFAVTTISRLTRKGRRPYAACAAAGGAVLLILFLFLNLLPATVRYLGA